MAHDKAYYEAEKKIKEALKSGATKLGFVKSFASSCGVNIRACLSPFSTTVT